MDSTSLLRHSLATLAYRSLRALHPPPVGFSSFQAGPGSRSAGEILAHMSDLMDWSARHLQGRGEWVEAPFVDWEPDKDRFFSALTKFDEMIKGLTEPLPDELAKRLLQGPIADALTHVGQLTLLRGLAGAPLRGENYYVADIMVGRTTPIQPPARRTF
jgi:hypothetical protein